ncbi:hypothetical protein Bbelb_204630 [Branchiostoma belcheri]|nr:hypothetical protein Bbelb_204630 [Branchiostoma belcheri]
MQEELTKFSQWSEQNFMLLNADKCKVMTFCFMTRPPPPMILTINGKELEIVAVARLLGITRLEHVQKRALRTILKGQYSSYDAALQLTGLKSLKDRREDLCYQTGRTCLFHSSPRLLCYRETITKALTALGCELQQAGITEMIVIKVEGFICELNYAQYEHTRADATEIPVTTTRIYGKIAPGYECIRTYFVQLSSTELLERSLESLDLREFDRETSASFV